MYFACWITKTTDTHSEYVTMLLFARQQYLRERASMLCSTYIACLVYRWLSSVSFNSILTAPAEITREVFCCVVSQHILLGDLTFDSDYALRILKGQGNHLV
jgi:hypothetical protein